MKIESLSIQKCNIYLQADIITCENLNGTFAYLDYVTICGKDQQEHDKNLKCFQDVATRRQITYNDDKSVFSTRKLAILGGRRSQARFTTPTPSLTTPSSN